VSYASREQSDRRSARPTVVDLFAGAGGLSLGFEQAGFDVVAAVDYDPTHGLIHKFNFPGCEVLCRDVHRLTAAEVLEAARVGARRIRPGNPWFGIVDAVIGGPSCQGFSTGGLRDDDDERNRLIGEFVRLVLEIRPRVFCLENVPGLLEPRFDDVRTSALKALRSAGYAISGGDRWYNASEFGVPQSRKRVLVLGVLDGPAPDLLDPADAPSATVRHALDGLPEIETYAALLAGAEVRLNVRDGRRRLSATSVYARRLSGVDDARDLGRPRITDANLLTCSLRTVHSAQTVARFAATEPGTVEPKSRLYRLSLDGVSRTLRAGTGRERGAHTSPRPIHPLLPRVITVREAARLHGYPDWFRLSGTSWHGHRQVGNSVPPPLARTAAQVLLAALDAKPRRPRSAICLGDPAWCATPPREAAILLGAIPEQLPPQRMRKPAATAGT
jgi:DNA (cytosine-5)-methyltransferase 1